MIEQIKTGAKYLFEGNLDPIIRTINYKNLHTNKYLHSFYNKSYCEVIEEDWDLLVIMDACRYDTFDDVNWIDGRLEQRYSAGGNSYEFLKRNFKNKRIHDTVYISTNPNSADLPKNTFYSHDLLDTRSNGLPLSPDKVTEAAIQAIDKYPDKRIIVHYMEPHYPYTDDYGQMLVSEYAPSDYADDLPLDWPLSAMKPGSINAPPPEKIKKAYRENLEYGLRSVENLITEFNGKIVISSDHGELFGEYIYPLPSKLWGHSEKIHHPKLRKVPWLVIESEQRRSIQSDPPKDSDLPSDEVIESRLEALGYK